MWLVEVAHVQREHESSPRRNIHGQRRLIEAPAPDLLLDFAFNDSQEWRLRSLQGRNLHLPGSRGADEDNTGHPFGDCRALETGRVSLQSIQMQYLEVKPP